jgi:hypothetical protein
MLYTYILVFLTKSQKSATMFTVIFSSAPPESYLPQITSNVDSDPVKSILRILEERGLNTESMDTNGTTNAKPNTILRQAFQAEIGSPMRFE